MSKTATEIWRDQVSRTMKDRNCDYTEAYIVSKAASNSLYNAMVEELEDSRPGTRRQEAAFANANEGLIHADPSPYDALMPEWALKTVGLRTGATIGEFRNQLRGGAKFDAKQRGALLKQLAELLQAKESLSFDAGWQKAKQLLPEIWAMEESATPTYFKTATVATGTYSDGAHDESDPARRYIPDWAWSAVGLAPGQLRTSLEFNQQMFSLRGKLTLDDARRFLKEAAAEYARINRVSTTDAAGAVLQNFPRIAHTIALG